MGIQLHMVSAKGKLAIAANASAAQAAVAAGSKVPAAKPVPWGGFSGRGVRLRTLSLAEKDDAERCAAKEIEQDTTNGMYNRVRAREGITRCITEVTKEREIADPGAASWVKVTQQDLGGDGRAKLSLDDLFTPKDLDVLHGWYRDNHDASQADLDAITGGAIETAENDG